MAKSKTKSKSKTRKRKPMATTKRKKRRSPSRTHRHLSAHHKTTTHRRRRRKKGLADSLSSNNLMKSLMDNGAGALGGGAFLATRVVKMHYGLRIALGLGMAMTASMLKFPNVASGISGATAYAVGDEFLGHKLHELNDDMEDCEYVHPDTLSDSGHIDDEGNPVVIDDEGVMYSLKDNDELHEIADAYSLHDGIQSTSGVPLYDNAYSLSSPYSLS